MKSWFIVSVLLLLSSPAFATTMLLCTQIKEVSELRKRNNDVSFVPVRRDVETSEVPLYFHPLNETDAFAGFALPMRILPSGYLTTLQVFESVVDGKTKWTTRIRTTDLESTIIADGFNDVGVHSFEEGNIKYETTCEVFAKRDPKEKMDVLSAQELRRLKLLGGPPNLRVYTETTHPVDRYELWKHIVTLPGGRAATLRFRIERLKQKGFDHFDLGAANIGAFVTGTPEVGCGVIGQLQCTSLILVAYFWSSQGPALASRKAASVTVEIRIFRRKATGEILRYTVGPSEVAIEKGLRGDFNTAGDRLRNSSNTATDRLRN